jgi:hypothetical protein
MSTEKAKGGYPIGYAGVSTLEQDEALQRDALTPGLPTWCESPCGPQRWGFGLEPPDEVDAG